MLKKMAVLTWRQFPKLRMIRKTEKDIMKVLVKKNISTYLEHKLKQKRYMFDSKKDN